MSQQNSWVTYTTWCVFVLSQYSPRCWRAAGLLRWTGKRWLVEFSALLMCTESLSDLQRTGRPPNLLRETDRQTETDRDRQRDRETERQTQRQTERHRDRHTHRDRHRHTDTHTETDTETDTDTHTDTHRHTQTHTTHTETDTDTHTDTHTHTHTDTHRHTHRERDRERMHLHQTMSEDQQNLSFSECVLVHCCVVDGVLVLSKVLLGCS